MSNFTEKGKSISWDFKGVNTKSFTHCFHSYPAMMIPQIAGRLLDVYGKKARLLFDPYCGTATSLVEGNLRGIDGIGFDINPLARLVAEAKTTPISLQVLDLYLKDFNDYLFKRRFGLVDFNFDFEVPIFSNLNFWFQKDTIEKLAYIKGYINKIEDKEIANFFKVSFSETIRSVSLTKNGEFKLVRIPLEQIIKFKPDVFGIIESKLYRNRNGLKEFIENKKGNAKSIICDFNTVYKSADIILQDRRVDLIITSPPYGDSKTTVAYGQFSRLSNQWLGIENANQIDNLSMGGKKAKEKFKFNFMKIDEAIEKIAEKDERRAYDVISFYRDYKSSIDNVSNVVKRNGFVAYVVGNRKVKGVELPTDEFTREFFIKNGFAHIKTIIRNIPNKRMPKKNSPTNETGKTGDTMNKEFIIILRKIGS